MNHDTRSLRTASLIAGLALALMAVLAAFGNFVAIQPLVTPGDAAKTAIDISNSEALFRWGTASLILVAILDIIVAAALLRLFEPVNRSLSITRRMVPSRLRGRLPGGHHSARDRTRAPGRSKPGVARN